ncbi:MAG TPA: ketoacyl-ACP synthase III [candidate division Zixibacteria bacterium]|nr:ketoacyl-ACP synthase III [candidate division Zixibacteria bacterium]HEQ99904.1 ketoacyl-ACP synthase III [candidate division Zixibacteria bacterium]
MNNQKIYSVIAGTGSYIPPREVPNSAFLNAEFYDTDGSKFEKKNEEIVGKLEEITGILERRYVTDDLVTSDIAYLAAKDALESSGTDKESLDYLVVAHNFGDVRADNRRSDFVPSLAARVKHKLEIQNPRTVAYDLPFGCPGWLQGVIQADYFLKSGDAKKALVIGAETLSRVSDPHDRDRMIYADGAGAAILEAKESDTPIGILSHATRSDTKDEAYMLWMDESYNSSNGSQLFLKMNGHKLYLYAIKTVPLVVKESLDRIEMGIDDIQKVLIHQANAKMDEAILKRIYKMYGNGSAPMYVMPMIISKLGNSSVATLPTLLDMMLKGKLNNHNIKSGDNVVFASVGAGMNINAMVYRAP